MKNKFAILHYNISHFTNSSFIDAEVIPFEGLSKISLLYLTSKSIDLNKYKFEFKLKFDHWKERNYMSTDKLWPLFSNELIKVIQKHYKNFVYFPAKLIDKKGNEHVNEFSVVQIPRLKGIVNEDSSVFTRDELFPALYASVQKIVLKEDTKLPSIFRIYEYPQVLIVSEKLYSDLLEKKFTNLSLTDMDLYDWSYL